MVEPAFIAVVSETRDQNSINAYAKLLKEKDKGLQTVIRRTELEPALKTYLEKGGLTFNTGTGSQSDLMGSGATVGFNIDFKAKEALKAGTGIKVGGKAIQLRSLQQDFLDSKIAENLRLDDPSTQSFIQAIRTANINNIQTRIEKKLKPRSRTQRRDPMQDWEAFVTANPQYSKYSYNLQKGIVLGKNSVGNRSPIEAEFSQFKRNRAQISEYEEITYKENIGGLEIEQALRALKSDKLIRYLEQYQKPVYQSLASKSKNILITYPGEMKNGTLSSLKVAQLNFPEGNHFTDKNFYIRLESSSLSSITFYPYVRDDIEKLIIKKLSEESLEFVQTQLVKNMKSIATEALQEASITARGVVGTAAAKTSTGLIGTFAINMLSKNNVPAGSIPQGKVTAIIPRRKSSAFTSRKSSVRSILRETRPYTQDMGDFITNDTITALTKREMLRRMPIGPVGGPPLSSKVLTYRTGRFVNSLQVFADMRNRSIQYYYSPRYWTHETTSRDPGRLIGASIASVTKALFNKKFNITKSAKEL